MDSRGDCRWGTLGWLARIDAGHQAWAEPVGGSPTRIFAGRAATAVDLAEANGIVYAAAVLDGEVWVGFGDLAP